MLIKMDGTDGPYWLRRKFDRTFTASERQLELIGSWRGHMSFEDLLVERGSPFAGSFEGIDRFQCDGREWVRFTHPFHEYCFDERSRRTARWGKSCRFRPRKRGGSRSSETPNLG
jgi:hypothetical protein